MKNLPFAWMVLTVGLVGCGARAIGGGADCPSLDEAHCRSYSRCTTFAPCCCGGPIRCVAAGTAAPVCTVRCAPTARPCQDSCAGKDEAVCNSTPGCTPDYCRAWSCTPTH